MKNKGFTLIELIAVIIILGITLQIVIPGIIKLTDKSKKKAFEATVSGYIKAMDLDNSDRGGLENNYTLTNGKITNDESGDNIKVKTGSLENGFLNITNKGVTNGQISSKRYCANIINNKINISNSC